MRLLQAFLLLLTPPCVAQETTIIFEVMLDDQKIGNVRAVEIKSANQIIRDIKSESDAKVFAFSVHLETESKVVKGVETLIEGIGYRHSNRGPGDVHAVTKRVGPKKYERERNNHKSTFENEEITFCVSDLFFEEPHNQRRIYSNMDIDMLELKSLGNGRYQVTSPEKKSTIYTYKNGKLMMIESDTPVGMVISKRI